MANGRDLQKGRPSPPTRHSYHAPPSSPPFASKQTVLGSYEGYVFAPSEHSGPGKRWTDARPIETLVSQRDLYDQVTKHRKSGKTALEYFCDPKFSQSKRKMVNKLIRDRNSRELGAPYELAAIQLERRTVKDEESDSGRWSKNDHKSGDPKLRGRTKYVHVVLFRKPREVASNPVLVSQTRDSSSNAAVSMESARCSSGEHPSRTVPSTPVSTPRPEYIPANAQQHSHANANGDGIDAQAFNQRDSYGNRSWPSMPKPNCSRNGTLQHCSSAASCCSSSSETAKPLSSRASEDAPDLNSYYSPQSFDRSNNARKRPDCLADMWPEFSPSAKPTQGDVSSHYAKKDPLSGTPLQIHHGYTSRPYVYASKTTQTDIAITNTSDDGHYKTLNTTLDSAQSFSGAKSPCKTETINLAALSTSEDELTPIEDSTDDGGSLHTSRSSGIEKRNSFEARPPWMNNLVPVTPSTTEDPLGIVRDELNAKAPICKQDIKSYGNQGNQSGATYQTAAVDDIGEPSESDYRFLHSDESSVTLPRRGVDDAHSSDHHTNASENKPSGDGSQDINSTVQMNKTPGSHLGGSDTATACFATHLGDLNPYDPRLATAPSAAEVHGIGDSQETFADKSVSAKDSENRLAGAISNSTSLGKPRSYERLRPTITPATDAPISAGIRKIYGSKADKDSNRSMANTRKQVKFSEPLTPASPLITPTSIDGSYSKTPLPSPRSMSVGSSSGPLPLNASRSTNRPPLHRQSHSSFSYKSAQPFEPTTSHHSSSVPAIPSRVEGRQSRKSNQRQANDYGSYDGSTSESSYGHDSDTDTLVRKVYLCEYRHCDRHRGAVFTTKKDLKAHRRSCHKRDRTGSE